MKQLFNLLLILFVTAFCLQGCRFYSTPDIPKLTSEHAKAAAEELLKLGTKLRDNDPPKKIKEWHGLLRLSSYQYASATLLFCDGNENLQWEGGFIYMLNSENNWVIREVNFSKLEEKMVAFEKAFEKNSNWSEYVYFPVVTKK